MKKTPIIILGFIAASSILGGVAYNTNMNKEEPKEVRQAEVAEVETVTLDNGNTVKKSDFESEQLTRTRVKYFLEIREQNPNMDEVAIWNKVNEKYPDPNFDPLKN